jgi:Ca2+-transporting ATPase
MLLVMLWVPGVIAFFKFEKILPGQVAICATAGFVSVIWMEIYKYFKRRRSLAN